MHNTQWQLRLPEAIRSRTIAFLNWYYNDLYVHLPPDATTSTPWPAQTTHAESSELIYDWAPCHGPSRLSLLHIPTGRSVANTFDITRMRDRDAATIPPPPSLLLTTWFELCHTLEWLSEGALAALRDQMDEGIAADTHQFGKPLYE